MSNYMYVSESRVAFHPGYYVQEILDYSGLTQEDFAKKMDTTPKNLCLLLKGEQRISLDMAMKLSRYTGTSIDHWLSLQQAYDKEVEKMKSRKEII